MAWALLFGSSSFFITRLLYRAFSASAEVVYIDISEIPASSEHLYGRCGFAALLERCRAAPLCAGRTWEVGLCFAQRKKAYDASGRDEPPAKENRKMDMFCRGVVAYHSLPSAVLCGVSCLFAAAILRYTLTEAATAGVSQKNGGGVELTGNLAWRRG